MLCMRCQTDEKLFFISLSFVCLGASSWAKALRAFRVTTRLDISKARLWSELQLEVIIAWTLVTTLLCCSPQVAMAHGHSAALRHTGRPLKLFSELWLTALWRLLDFHFVWNGPTKIEFWMRTFYTSRKIEMKQWTPWNGSVSHFITLITD